MGCRWSEVQILSPRPIKATAWRSRAKPFSFVVSRIAAFRIDGIQIGLTATPCVARPDYDDGDEDQLFVRDTLRFFEVDRPTFVYTLKQAVEEGYLVGYQIYRARTVKTAAEGGFEVRRDEIVWDELDTATRQQLEAAFGDKDTIIVDPSALERKFTIPERNRAIVRQSRCSYNSRAIRSALRTSVQTSALGRITVHSGSAPRSLHACHSSGPTTNDPHNNRASTPSSPSNAGET